MRNQSLRLCLFLSIAISLIVQLAFIPLSAIVKTPQYFQVDREGYISIAGNLFFKGEYSIGGYGYFEDHRAESPTRIRQPGYPLYLCVFYWMLGNNRLVVQLSQIALNVATICMIYHISRLVFGDRLWGWTIILVGLYFPLWIMSVFILSEILFTFLLTLAMLLLLEAMRLRRRSVYFFTGLAFGAAFLTRPAALPVVILSIFPIYFSVKKVRGAVEDWAILLLAFVICISPWFIRNAVALGDYTPLSTDGGYNVWCGTIDVDYPARGPDAESASILDRYGMGTREDCKRFMELAMSNIKADPLGQLRRGFLRILRTWSYIPGSRAYSGRPLLFGLSRGVQLIILFFAVCTMCTLDRRRAAYLLLPAVSMSAAMILSYAPPRHLLPVMPLVVVCAGQGIASCKRWLHFSSLRKG